MENWPIPSARVQSPSQQAERQLKALWDEHGGSVISDSSALEPCFKSWCQSGGRGQSGQG